MFQYNLIDATKELNVVRALKTYAPPFSILNGYRLIDDGVSPEATVIIETHDQKIHEAATGNGPVDALANVLKKALIPLFPVINSVKLIDYHANIIDAKRGTRTEVEVTIFFTNGEEVWKVYSLSENINSASFNVLVDGFEFAIMKYKK